MWEQSLLAMTVCQSMCMDCCTAIASKLCSHRRLQVVFPSDYASGILRKPTAKRFQPLMALIATVRSTISLGLKCSLSRA